MWEFFFAGTWTVFLLNFPNNLLILYEVHCWNGKEVIPTGTSFSAVLLCFLLMDMYLP
jgi:hypothetical protein